MNNTLHLTIKEQWSDMILSGEKAGEYRDIKPYYNLRFIGKEYDAVIFKDGYTRDAPSLIIELKSIHSGTGGPEWGAEASEKYFVLYLGEATNKKNINK